MEASTCLSIPPALRQIEAFVEIQKRLDVPKDQE